MFTFEVMEQRLKIVIDIGNTRTKIAVFKKNSLLECQKVKGNFKSLLSELVTTHGVPSACIISRVAMNEEELMDALTAVRSARLLFFRSGLLLPLKVLYKTPETLGNDRLANACGAWNLYPGQNSLVVDMGTCIKYDFVSEGGTYPGGSISPGLSMRYKALSRFTSQLPNYKPVEEFPELTGQSTENAMRSGVENGLLEEVKGIILRYQAQFDQTQIILTGGDSSKFADKLKSPIFVAPNLTLTGLKVILDHNDQ